MFRTHDHLCNKRLVFNQSGHSLYPKELFCYYPFQTYELSLFSYEQAAVIDLSWDSEKLGFTENNYFILDTAKSFYLTDVFTITVIFPACYLIFIVSVKLLERK